MLPSFFIAHGAPLIAIEDNEYTQFLNELGRTLPRPKAIVLFSAHWESAVQQISSVVEKYETIYDFSGFVPDLYSIQYPANGKPALAHEIEELFTQSGVPFQMESKRGLDHGAWVVLRLMYPNADIPVISMSVNPDLSPEEQYKIGKALTTLRQKDVLVIASGGLVHNLRAVKFAEDNGQIDQWALDFDNWLGDHLYEWDLESLYNYASLAPSADMAVPPRRNEHFIPLFYAMGAADDTRKATLLHRSYRYANLGHSVWQFG